MSTTKGNAFEAKIASYFEREISNGRFYAKQECCKVRRKPSYYSRDRGSDITFDVSIELFLPGAPEPSSIVIIECKNYSHAVPVDDVEEFYTKVQQVGAANTKAVVATTRGFQSGALEFARSKRIGLLRYIEPNTCKWDLHRSPSALVRESSADLALQVRDGLTDIAHRSQVYDLFLQSPNHRTNSLWMFVEDLLLDGELSPLQIQSIAADKVPETGNVPYLERAELEARAAEVLKELGYSGGEMPLEALCVRESKRTGLHVLKDVEVPNDSVLHAPLGRISFNPPTIEIYRSADGNPGRLRFTLAHELAHSLLDHGAYLARESCDDDDFVLHRSSRTVSPDVARLEFQANYLAASLLLPRLQVISDFVRLTKDLDIRSRGAGPLYLDDQPCNQEVFKLVTSHFMRRYGVSRAAVRIRLQTLKILKQDVVRQPARSSFERVAFPDTDGEAKPVGQGEPQ